MLSVTTRSKSPKADAPRTPTTAKPKSTLQASETAPSTKAKSAVTAKPVSSEEVKPHEKGKKKVVKWKESDLLESEIEREPSPVLPKSSAPAAVAMEKEKPAKPTSTPQEQPQAQQAKRVFVRRHMRPGDNIPPKTEAAKVIAAHSANPVETKAVQPKKERPKMSTTLKEKREEADKLRKRATEAEIQAEMIKEDDKLKAAAKIAAPASAIVAPAALVAKSSAPVVAPSVPKASSSIAAASPASPPPAPSTSKVEVGYRDKSEKTPPVTTGRPTPPWTTEGFITTEKVQLSKKWEIGPITKVNTDGKSEQVRSVTRNNKEKFQIHAASMTTQEVDKNTFIKILRIYKAAHGDKLPHITTDSEKAREVWKEALQEVYPKIANDERKKCIVIRDSKVAEKQLEGADEGKPTPSR